jgi:hypothetical protein
MGDQSGGHVRYDGPGSLWKSSWKGRKPYSEFCCFQGFARGEGGRYYEEPGGALDIVPAAGYWLNFLVGIGGALPVGVDKFIARNGTAPGGWELIANQALIGTDEGVTFTFRVYDGAGITASTTTAVFTLAPLVGNQLPGPMGFRISAFFLPPSGPAPFGEIILAIEGSLFTPAVGLLAAYANGAPSLLLGIGTGALAEDWTPPQSICGLVGGEGDYGALESVAHRAWIQQVADESQVVVMPSMVGGAPVPGYTADHGWRGNNPYINPGDAPDPLLPFVGADSLVEAGGTGTLVVDCGTATFWADAV